jgi:hypothetical protein
MAHGHLSELITPTSLRLHGNAGYSQFEYHNRPSPGIIHGEIGRALVTRYNSACTILTLGKC